MSFSKSSHTIEITSNFVLSACCRPRKIGSRNMFSSLNLDLLLGNQNGHFVWGSSAISKSARNPSLRGAILRAELRTRDGKWKVDEIDLDLWVRNDNGMLRAVTEKPKPPPISKLREEKKLKVEVKELPVVEEREEEGKRRGSGASAAATLVYETTPVTPLSVKAEEKQPEKPEEDVKVEEKRPQSPVAALVLVPEARVEPSVPTPRPRSMSVSSGSFLALTPMAEPSEQKPETVDEHPEVQDEPVAKKESESTASVADSTEATSVNSSESIRAVGIATNTEAQAPEAVDTSIAQAVSEIAPESLTVEEQMAELDAMDTTRPEPIAVLASSASSTRSQPLPSEPTTQAEDTLISPDPITETVIIPDASSIPTDPAANLVSSNPLFNFTFLFTGAGVKTQVSMGKLSTEFHAAVLPPKIGVNVLGKECGWEWRGKKELKRVHIVRY